jgi:hypothetical protein
MSFFAEKTRVRVDARQGLVRISVRSDESSVDEFVFPFDECDSLFEAAAAALDFSSKNFKLRFGGKKIFLQFRENSLKRKIYNLQPVEFQMLCAQFASERIKVEKLDPSERSIISETCDDIMSLSVNLNRHFEKLFREVRLVGKPTFDLEALLRSIDGRLLTIEQVLRDGGMTSSAPGAQSFAMDDELFIPESFREDFDGNLNVEQTQTESSSDSAAEALKKLRSRKK